ncbi:MAG: site-specific DNA-methyltransferase [Methylocystaceae bacterium]|nr:site-specific DNA-methyltransferase [Methylocystaceae bacterium]
MSSKLDQLKDKLREMFQMDQADLDFGIYRIMNAKRDEVETFLNEDLLPTVKTALAEFQPAGMASKREELDSAIKNAQALGVDPNAVPRIQELRAELENGVDLEKLEEQVYSDLYTFFARYYSDGDFMSLRRYKEGVYALPYEGEEVKLHWANADQYYIKSAENFQTYAFKVPVTIPAVPGATGTIIGKRVRFELVSATTEQNNNKAAADKERRFILHSADPIAVENGELIIRFEYRADEEKRKQKDLNALAVEAILGLTEGSPLTSDIEDWNIWLEALSTNVGTDKNKDRTMLEKHLTDYTAKNSFDYFIHKDLGKFLKRELDFFIQNEVMVLDDLLPNDPDKLNAQIMVSQQMLSKAATLKKIALKVIEFLAQLEDFQKKLWLKKKFVLETNWLITLDRIDEKFYAEIAANDAQREEWIKLFAIDEIGRASDEDGEQGSMSFETTPAYSNPLTVEFLKANPPLVLDTAFFEQDFKDRLFAEVDDLDERTNGLLVNGDNFHALNLLQESYHERVDCVYIDPPYNTGGDGFFYKDAYQHSSWLSMISDRLKLSRGLLSDKGVFFASIDANERAQLEKALENAYGVENKVEEIIWVQNSNKNQSPTYSTNHEYVEVFAKNLHEAKADFRRFREPKPGLDELQELLDEITPQYLPLADVEARISELFKKNKAKVKAALAGELNGEDLNAEDWKGLYNYRRAEYRNQNNELVDYANAKNQEAKIWVWREDNPSMPQVKEDSQKAAFKDPTNPEYRFYEPIHPKTGEPCPAPKRGWSWPKQPFGNQSNCFDDLAADHRIAWGEDQNKIPQVKRFVHEVKTNVGKSVVTDFTDGEKQLYHLFGKNRAFSNPKPTTLIQRLVEHTTWSNHTVMDFFAGSGTTYQAVVDANKRDNSNRNFCLVEVGTYFDEIVMPRVKKVTYSSNWKDGQADRSDGNSIFSKYIRLESYEDSTNNLNLSRTDQQDELLKKHKDFREDYMLHYMLDVESRGSLLDLDRFVDPLNVTMKVTRDDETRNVRVDMVETFNYLLGLRVKTMRRSKGIYEVTGTMPDGDNTLIIWRNTNECDNDALDEWFQKQQYNTRDMEFDLIFVNGDNNLENLRRADETWKVRLTEETFHTLMFDVEDV